jgi:hypothetical protein
LKPKLSDPGDEVIATGAARVEKTDVAFPFQKTQKINPVPLNIFAALSIEYLTFEFISKY